MGDLEINQNRKDGMKKLLMGLGLIVLLAGCASRDNGMGGTSDESNQSMKTDTYNTNSSDQFHNNANNGTGSSTAPGSNQSTP
jgi:uncharacterized lipoprotein YajG